MTTSVRTAVAEFVATALLLAAIVGSGVMGERLAGGNVAVALLANSLATGAALVALIATFGPISGAHMNPLVTIAGAALGGQHPRTIPIYLVAQVAGAFAGVALANGMFDLPVFFASTRERTGFSVLLSEGVATFGLLAVVLGTTRHAWTLVPFAVGGYIAAAYWFTASTSFANPAVTMARAVTDTFAGIDPGDVVPFVVAQAAGAAVAVLLFRWLLARPRDPSPAPSDPCKP